MMVILMTDRFILLQLTSPEEVTRYDVIYRFFNLLLVLHTLINAPLWAIYTEAYEKKDFVWIEKTMRNLIGLSGAYILVLGAMVLFGDVAIRIWLGKGDLGLTTGNYLFMALLIWFSIVHSILAYFTNGISKTNLQLATSLIGAVINIPLSILFVNTFSMGLNGVILATIISLSLFCFTGPFQVIQVIRSMKIQSKTTS
jgi:O-antigen/teichoic acid export membrane protein